MERKNVFSFQGFLLFQSIPVVVICMLSIHSLGGLLTNLFFNDLFSFCTQHLFVYVLLCLSVRHVIVLSALFAHYNFFVLLSSSLFNVASVTYVKIDLNAVLHNLILLFVVMYLYFYIVPLFYLYLSFIQILAGLYSFMSFFSSIMLLSIFIYLERSKTSFLFILWKVTFYLCYTYMLVIYYATNSF